MPPCPKCLESRLEQIESRDVQSKNVNLPVTVMSAQLYTRNNTNSERLASGRCEWNAGKRVVICESECAQPCGVRRSNYCVGRKYPVGCRRVRMKIDEARASRGVAALTHRA